MSHPITEPGRKCYLPDRKGRIILPAPLLARLIRREGDPILLLTDGPGRLRALSLEGWMRIGNPIPAARVRPTGGAHRFGVGKHLAQEMGWLAEPRPEVLVEATEEGALISTVGFAPSLSGATPPRATAPTPLAGTHEQHRKIEEELRRLLAQETSRADRAELEVLRLRRRYETAERELARLDLLKRQVERLKQMRCPRADLEIGRARCRPALAEC